MCKYILYSWYNIPTKLIVAVSIPSAGIYVSFTIIALRSTLYIVPCVSH